MMIDDPSAVGALGSPAFLWDGPLSEEFHV